MECDDLQANLAAEADGVLDERTSRQVELHVKACSNCASQLAGLRAVVAELRSIPPASAPAGLHKHVMEAVRNEPVPGAGSQLLGRGQGRWLLAAAALVAGLAFLLRPVPSQRIALTPSRPHSTVQAAPTSRDPLFVPRGEVALAERLSAGWHTITDRAPLGEGGRVRTAGRASGQLFLASHAGRVDLDELTSVGLPKPGTLELERGRIHVETTSQLHVVTPYAVIAVLGTQFTVVVVEGRGTDVSVQAGVVEILDRRTGGRVQLSRGQMASIPATVKSPPGGTGERRTSPERSMGSPSIPASVAATAPATRRVGDVRTIGEGF